MPMVKLPLRLEHALLGFVRSAPMHAYEIHARLMASAELGLVWRMKQSQLYALLTRLEAAGYLAGTTELQGSRPPRRPLTLTPVGEAAFVRWLATPVANGRDFRQEFLAKLYFAQRDGQPAVAELVTAQRRATELLLDEQRAALDALLPGRAYERLVVQYRVGQIEATLRWLELCLVPPPALAHQ